jgi:DNA-binding transcriptional LysR family regulator
MPRKAPPLEATEAFLLAARAESFRAAADELALSPSAFSRRIQQLEYFIGVPLFDRSGTSICLTEIGRHYLQEIEPAMETIRRATADLRGRKKAGKLRLATSHSLAVSWLIPRLSDLFQRHGLEIELLVTRGAHVLRSGAADLAIWGSSGLADDLPHEKIISLDGVLVSAPLLADGSHPPHSLDQLPGHPMLSVKGGPDLWRRWLAETGYKGAAPVFAACFETSHLMYEAAAGGLGITLAVPLLTERFMRDKLLYPCADTRAPVGVDYSLYYSATERQRRSPIGIFKEWLVDEAERSRQAFDNWRAPLGPHPDISESMGIGRIPV